MLEKTKEFLLSYSFIFCFFSVLWLSAWFADGVLGYKLDLDKLNAFGIYILSKYGLDSKLNTPQDLRPK